MTTPATDVTFIQPPYALPAVPTLLQEELELALRPGQYGAAGDGVADDWQALTDLLTATGSAGAHIEFEAGRTYRCGQPLMAAFSKAVIRGNGATIFYDFNPVPPASPLHCWVLTGDDILIDNVCFASNPSFARNGAGAAILLSGAERVSVTNCKFTNLYGSGVYSADGSRDILVSGNRFENTKADAVHISDGTQRFVVHGNLVLGSGDDGISCVWYGGLSEFVGVGVVSNNVISGSLGAGLAICHAKQVLVTGNVVRGAAYSGINVYNWNRDSDLAEDITVRNNLFSECGRGAIDGNYQNAAGIYVNGCRRLVIDGNIIHNPYSLALAAGDGIFVGRYIDLVIRDNEFRELAGCGVRVPVDANTTELTRLSIIGNHFSNIGEGIVDLTCDPSKSLDTVSIVGNTGTLAAYSGGTTSFISVARTGSSPLRIYNNANLSNLKAVAIDLATCSDVIEVGTLVG